MTRRRIALLAMIAALAAGAPGLHAGARKDVAAGNSAYESGNFDGALDAYERASVEMPESAEILYNKGAALYRKNDFKKALEMFEKAAMKTRDPVLEAKARFALGNTEFAEAERQKDSDLDKSVEACRRSVAHYREALRVAPDMREAAENIEVVRTKLKALLDEIKKKQEQQSQQQQAQQQAADKLKKLIAAQDRAAAESVDLDRQQKTSPDPASTQGQSSDLAGKQNRLREETGNLARELRNAQQQAQQQGQQQGNAGMQDAAGKIDEAAKNQDAAGDSLARNEPGRAVADQRNASERMREALDSLQDKDGNESGQGQGKKAGGANQEAGKEKENGDNQQEQGDGQEQEVIELDEQARELIDEETDKRKHRNMLMQGGYEAVDKDW